MWWRCSRSMTWDVPKIICIQSNIQFGTVRWAETWSLSHLCLYWIRCWNKSSLDDVKLKICLDLYDFLYISRHTSTASSSYKTGTSSLDVSHSQLTETYLFSFEMTSYHKDIISWSPQVSSSLLSHRRYLIPTHGIYHYTLVIKFSKHFAAFWRMFSKQGQLSKDFPKQLRILGEFLKKTFCLSSGYWNFTKSKVSTIITLLKWL